MGLFALQGISLTMSQGNASTRVICLNACRCRCSHAAVKPSDTCACMLCMHWVSCCECLTGVTYYVLFVDTVLSMTLPLVGSNCCWHCRNSQGLDELLQKPGTLLSEFRNNIHVTQDPATAGISSTQIRHQLAQVRPPGMLQRCCWLQDLLLHYPIASPTTVSEYCVLLTL